MLNSKIRFMNIAILVAIVALVSLSGLQLHFGKNEDIMSSTMVGTWFFDNPLGDDEQMAIFDDGSVVVLYSNGHRDETYYDDGYVTLAEYVNLELKMAVLDDKSLIQYSEAIAGGGLAKKWRRIDAEPQTELLRALTGNQS